MYSILFKGTNALETSDVCVVYTVLILAVEVDALINRGLQKKADFS